jgi:hypothetical protein
MSKNLNISGNGSQDVRHSHEDSKIDNRKAASARDPHAKKDPWGDNIHLLQ